MFQQLLEELRKVKEEMTSRVNSAKKLQEEVNRLTSENKALKEEIANHVCDKEIVEVPVPVECDHSALEQEIADLKQQIADHVCEKEVVEVPVEVLIPCTHEEEIEVLKAQVASIQAEKEQQAKQHEENVLALQAEIDALKKILATD